MNRLRDWATGHPVDLAAFRIAVSVVVLFSVDVWTAAGWAHAALPPVSEGLARGVTALVLLSAFFTLIGLFTRISSLVATLSLGWLLSVPQQSGQVMHTHHLLWFFAILAAAPAGDAWSLDARRRPAEAPSLAHGVPVRVAWLSMGLIFFFPGVWKLNAGAAWLDGLPALVEWKWFQLADTPWVQLSPRVLWWGGVASIAFELSFVALIISRRTRLLAVALAFLFHQGIWLVMGIVFSSLWLCDVVFLPWARWLRVPSTGVKTRAAWPSLALGVVLLGAQLFTGVTRRERSWPFACYPTFSDPAPRAISWLEVEEVSPRGTELVFSRGALRGREAQRWWGVMAEQPPGVFYRQWRGASPPDVSEVRYFRVTKQLGAGVPPVRERVR